MIFGFDTVEEKVNNFETKTYNTKVDVYVAPKNPKDFYFAQKIEQQLRYEGLFGKYNLTDDYLKDFFSKYKMKFEHNGINYIAFDEHYNLAIKVERNYELAFPAGYIENSSPIAYSDYSTGFNGKGF